MTELQLQTSNNSVFDEVDTTEAAWDQEELPKLNLLIHHFGMERVCFLHLSTLCKVCDGVL